jgi:hypothetical protein
MNSTNNKNNWTVLKWDKKQKKTIIINSVPTVNSVPIINSNKNPNHVLNALVHLHEKRTNDYIEMWGYDEWEKEFLFPNYDYNYFDKLDKIYEEEMKIQRIEDEANDCDEFINYWKY